MTETILKAIGIWLVIVFAAIMNGIFRERILVSYFGAEMALPLSGLLLSFLVLLVSFIFISFIKSEKKSTFIGIGIFWVALTLVFEFIFGYFLTGKSWQEVTQVFNLLKGNLLFLCYS